MLIIILIIVNKKKRQTYITTQVEAAIKDVSILSAKIALLVPIHERLSKR